MLSLFGWGLLLVGVVIFGLIAVSAFLADDSVSAGMKLAIALPYLGLALLFVAELRRRLRESRTDKYKDVEILR